MSSEIPLSFICSPQQTWQQLQRKILLCFLDLDLLRYSTFHLLLKAFKMEKVHFQKDKMIHLWRLWGRFNILGYLFEKCKQTFLAWVVYCPIYDCDVTLAFKLCNSCKYNEYLTVRWRKEQFSGEYPRICSRKIKRSNTSIEISIIVAPKWFCDSQEIPDASRTNEKGLN